MPRLFAFPTLLTAVEREQLLAACDRRTLLGSRDYTILALLVDGALRVREVLQLTGADVERSALLVPATKGRARLVTLTPRVVEAMHHYAAQRPHAPTLDAPLFLGADGQPLDVSGVSTLVQAAAQRAGLPHHVSWAHHLRLSVLHDRLFQAQGE